MDQHIADLTALIAVVIGLALAYAKGFGGYQTQLVQWVIDAGQVPSRWRGLLNVAVGVSLAVAFTLLGALYLGDWSLVAVGLFAGVLASVEAGRVHDTQTGDVALLTPIVSTATEHGTTVLPEPAAPEPPAQ